MRSFTARIRKSLSQPIENWNKVIIGAVALVAIVVVALGLIKVGQAGIGKHSVRAQFAQAAGLTPGDSISVAGVPVGTVKDTRLDHTFVTVTMEVGDDVPLGSDTRASIKLTTLLGSRYIELSPAGSGSLPDDLIPLSHTAVPYDLQQVMQNATTTFEQVDAEKIGTSMTTLSRQLDGTPELVPQALTNIQSLSTIIADRRGQIGSLLTSTQKLTAVVRRQESGLGQLMTQGRDLLRALLTRQVMIDRLLDSTTVLANQLRQVVVADRSGLDKLVTNLDGLLDSLRRNDNLLRNTLQILPVPVRNFVNVTGTGNETDFTSLTGPLIDSWMCAISKQANLANLPPYFKDCR
ncbi:MCE family protein [Gordonia sp. DT101]|uniref:MCE family protein n=1 Tax=Gordonia sp. DT101 TaxID=3416545 RepID=UPI003CE7C138